MSVQAFQITAADNVATLTGELAAPGPVRIIGGFTDGMVTARGPIARGHKIALRDMVAGEEVVKFGAGIGRATCGHARGAPLSYEMMPGNTADKTTLLAIIALLKKRHGQIGRIWVMDRGIPTEEALAQMRACDPPMHYLVRVLAAEVKAAIGEHVTLVYVDLDFLRLLRSIATFLITGMNILPGESGLSAE